MLSRLAQAGIFEYQSRTISKNFTPRFATSRRKVRRLAFDVYGEKSQPVRAACAPQYRAARRPASTYYDCIANFVTIKKKSFVYQIFQELLNSVFD